MSSSWNLYLLGVFYPTITDHMMRSHDESLSRGASYLNADSVHSAVMDWVFREVNNTCSASLNVKSGFSFDCFESIQLSWFKTPAGVVTVSLPNSSIAGLETCLFHHRCLDLIQCINVACMSQALKSDNMENYLRSIRKLHLAPVQGLRWQAWTKQSILLLILDYRARQQSDDLSRCCWYSFLVTGLAAFSSGSVIAWSQVWRSPLQLSRGEPQQSITEGLLRGDVRSQAAADVSVCDA